MGPIFTGSNCVIGFLAGGAPELEGLAASVAPRLEAIAANEYKLNTNLKINLMQLELFVLVSFVFVQVSVDWDATSHMDSQG